MASGRNGSHANGRAARRRTQPLRIDFEENDWDKAVREFSPHLTAQAIVNALGGVLTINQVSGRRQAAGPKYSPLAFRRGESPEAKLLILRIKKKLGTSRELRMKIDRMLGQRQKDKQRPRIG
jgi:hypothetical protein